MRGTVKFYSQSKGFGYIRLADSDEDLFVHSSDLVDSIRQNDQVEFDVARGKRGMNAVHVRVKK